MMQFNFERLSEIRRFYNILFFFGAAFLILPAISRAGDTSLADLSEELSTVVHDVSAAVVSISVTADKVNPDKINSKMDLRVPSIASTMKSSVSSNHRNCQATGFYFDNQGHILTTASVLNRARAVEVTLVDGQTMPGKIVGYDMQTRIGVIQVESIQRAAPEIAEKKLKLGALVICLGNQAGLHNTPLLGLVSGLDRCLNSVLPSEPVIQISAPISPGMAGAPVINCSGEIVGMICATYLPKDRVGSSVDSETSSPLAANSGSPKGSPSDLYFAGSNRRSSREYVLSSNMTVQAMAPDQFIKQDDYSEPTASNVGFAVPISKALRIADELIAKGHITRGWLGILTADARDAVPEDVRQHLHLGENEGVVVRGFIKESPAGEAGINSGDILLSINGRKVSSSLDVFNLVDELGPGTPVALSIIRDGQYRTLNTTLAERPANF